MNDFAGKYDSVENNFVVSVALFALASVSLACVAENLACVAEALVEKWAENQVEKLVVDNASDLWAYEHYFVQRFVHSSSHPQGAVQLFEISENNFFFMISRIQQKLYGLVED